MTTDGTAVYDQLASAKVNLNRINSFHNMIKDYYKHYRGVASKYINRYASMFAYAWKMNSVVNEDSGYEETLNTVRKDCIWLTDAELKDYCLYVPDNLIFRVS